MRLTKRRQTTGAATGSLPGINAAQSTSACCRQTLWIGYFVSRDRDLRFRFLAFSARVGSPSSRGGAERCTTVI